MSSSPSSQFFLVQQGGELDSIEAELAVVVVGVAGAPTNAAVVDAGFPIRGVSSMARLAG